MERARGLERVQFDKLCHLLHALLVHDKPTVVDATLEFLDVVKTTDLDVDNLRLDSQPRFFRPFSGDQESLEETTRRSHGIWHYHLDKNKDKPGWIPCAPYAYPERKVEWFLYCYDDLWWERNERSERGDDTDSYDVTDREGIDFSLPDHEWVTKGKRTAACIPGNVFFARNKPHVAMVMLDSTVGLGDTTLLSEVEAATRLCKEQLREGLFTQHHIKPVLIFTIQWETHGRVTQAYVDPKTNKLVLRQSRLLDLDAREPTPDAYLLLRWMFNSPAGDTGCDSGISGWGEARRRARCCRIESP